MGLENPLHIAILLVILLLLFGAKRLPEMGRGLGSGIRSFKAGLSGHGDEESQPGGSQPAAQAPAQLPAPQLAPVPEPQASPAPQPEASPAPEPHAAPAPQHAPRATADAEATDSAPVGHPV